MTGPRTPRKPQPPRQSDGAPRTVADEAPTQDESLAPLLRAAALGNEAAWREIVRRYAHRVFALARSRRMVESDAEEVTQSVFATVAERLRSGDYAEQGRFEPWLFRITINRVRDEARRVRRHAEPTDPASLGGLAAPRQPAPRTPPSEIAALREALNRLSDPDREIIELRHHAELSFRQIADLLGEPLGTVLARHHRALRKMREILEPDRRSSSGDSA